MKIKPPLAFVAITIFFLTPGKGYAANTQVDTLYRQACDFYYNRQYDSAIRLGNQLRELASDQGIDSIHLKTISMIAKSYDKKGDNEKSLHTLYDLLETAEKLNNPWGQASAFFNLGRKFANAYDYDIALRHMKNAREQYELAGNPKGQVLALYHIARILHKKMAEDPSLLYLADSALMALGEAFTVVPPNDSSLICCSINNLQGIVEFERKNYPEARKYYHLPLKYTKVDSYKSAIAYHNIGETYLYEGNLEQAKHWLEKALEVKKSLKKPTSTLLTLHLMARVCEQQGDIPQALDLLDKGLALVDMSTLHENTVMALSLVTKLVAKHPENGLSKSKLTNYLTAYYVQNEALRALKTQLEESSYRREIQAMHKVYEIEKQASVERQEAISRIIVIAFFVGLAIAVTLVTPLLARNKRLTKKYEKEKKLVVHTSEKLYESLSLNKSLRKSYNEIYKTFKGGDYLESG